MRVCTIMPGGVDTPAYRLAANFTRRSVQPSAPLMPPEKIARAIVRCARRPRPEVVVGNSVRTLRLAHALSPRLAEDAVARGIETGILGDGPNEPNPGNLFHPQPEWTGTDAALNEEAKRRARDSMDTAARRAIAGATAGASVLASGLLAYHLLRKTRG